MEYVRRQMGHASSQTTIANYGHLERTVFPEAAARTEAAILARHVPRRPAADRRRY
jgi:hypothetical protein